MKRHRRQAQRTAQSGDCRVGRRCCRRFAAHAGGPARRGAASDRAVHRPISPPAISTPAKGRRSTPSSCSIPTPLRRPRRSTVSRCRRSDRRLVLRAGRGEGQFRHLRHVDRRRIARAHRQSAAARCVVRRAPAQGRRHHRRQDQHGRVRHGHPRSLRRRRSGRRRRYSTRRWARSTWACCRSC